VAELTAPTAAAIPSACCAPEQQTACCEPQAKASCCSPEHSSCGCSAGETPPSQGDIREHVRARYAAAARNSGGTDTTLSTTDRDA
jgi:hypothetical protein